MIKTGASCVVVLVWDQLWNQHCGLSFTLPVHRSSTLNIPIIATRGIPVQLLVTRWNATTNNGNRSVGWEIRERESISGLGNRRRSRPCRLEFTGNWASFALLIHSICQQRQRRQKQLSKVALADNLSYVGVWRCGR